MQTMEAIISFVFFMFFATYMLSQLDYAKPNYSLYEYQLANDIWRVLYLKGDLQDYPASANLKNDMKSIRELTGFCTYVEGIAATGCSSGSCSAEKITMKKTWLKDGKADELQFSVCVPES